MPAPYSILSCCIESFTFYVPVLAAEIFGTQIETGSGNNPSCAPTLFGIVLSRFDSGIFGIGYCVSEYLGGKDRNVKSEGFYATGSVCFARNLDFIASFDYFNPNKAADFKQNNYIAGVP